MDSCLRDIFVSTYMSKQWTRIVLCLIDNFKKYDIFEQSILYKKTFPGLYDLVAGSSLVTGLGHALQMIEVEPLHDCDV